MPGFNNCNNMTKEQSDTMQSIRESVAHLFEGYKFKGVQQVYFFNNECVEIGVIQEVKNHTESSQPSYIVTFLDDSFNLANVEVDEEDIFSSYQEILEFAKAIFTREKFRQVFKHFTKTQFLKQEFQEEVSLDEFIYQYKK